MPLYCHFKDSKLQMRTVRLILMGTHSTYVFTIMTKSAHAVVSGEEKRIP